MKHKYIDEILEIKDDRSPFAFMSIVARSQKVNVEEPLVSMSAPLFHEPSL